MYHRDSVLNTPRPRGHTARGKWYTDIKVRANDFEEALHLMSYIFTLDDGQYRIVKAAADAAGRTPEELFLAWAMAEEAQYREAHPTYYETDD
jgi:hypothetical protein